MKKYRILLVENDDYFKNIAWLNTLEGIEVVGNVKNGMEAISLCETIKPDIVFIDMVLEDITGLEAARWIKEQNASVKVFLFSYKLRLEFLRAGIEMGIDGYLKKGNSRAVIEKAFEAAREGYFFVPDRVEEYSYSFNP